MNRITIDVSKDEFDFIREAIEMKYRNLISYLDACETFSSSNLSEEIEDHKKELEVIERWNVSTFDKANAPYGLKKDGTPKKPPGRPSKKGAKK